MLGRSMIHYDAMVRSGYPNDGADLAPALRGAGVLCSPQVAKRRREGSDK